MFKKILIANRGEIACRVIKTARKMGIKTVAVYSDADADALHVQMADEKVHLGPPPAAQSYLLADKIIQACLDTGAEAVHPGYGFLSERAFFCEELKKNGIAFIGPDVHAIESMGDKIESKKLAREAGVSTVPGYIDVIPTPEEAVRIAAEIGYPVMIKASAGGGGKGMRIAWNDAEAHEGFISATNEAKASFGDDRVFVEKFVDQPRHIEIQVLGDKHGNVLYLNERECSIQRRNQKVVEEAPSPFLDAATRKAMGEQAVALAKAVGYHSAGTVEFIVDGKRNFYFLEMNTRLQVEHPVTEMTTGIDLVEQMIRVAYGEKLPFAQKDIGIHGWAIESRVYAEDPYRGFLPSIGRLVRYVPPAENDHVRVDTGVFEGAEISMFYDPMIAKLVTWGKDRKHAIAEQAKALNQFYIRGIGHNIDFVNAIMSHPRFISGNITTAFIAEEYPEGFKGAPLSDQGKAALVGVAAFANQREAERNAEMADQMTVPHVSNEWVVTLGDEAFPVTVTPKPHGYDVANGKFIVSVTSDWSWGEPQFLGTVNGHAFAAAMDKIPSGYTLEFGGAQTKALVRSPREHELAQLMPVKLPPDTSKYLLCPMPGLVVSIAVAEGDAVVGGQALAVVEAMKMENILRAEKDGKVLKVAAKPGQSLAVDAVILEFE